MLTKRLLLMAAVAGAGSMGALSARAGNIVLTAAGAVQFGTLLAAAKAAGLTEALASTNPITVFALTDDAFARLPRGTVEALLRLRAGRTGG